jgi:hypothetical protein
MNLNSVLLINLFFMLSSIRSEYDLNKSWPISCVIYSCESTLHQCMNDGCFGKLSCNSCIETYLASCSRCVDDIYDEAAQITLPDNRKTIICDINNQLHTTVCNFFCRSLFQLYYICEIITNMPVCICMDTTTTTTKKPDNPSKCFL